MKWGMVIDLRRCLGCYACQAACKAEHGTPPGVFYTRVLRQEQGKYPHVTTTFLPVQCNQCEDPPCVDVCPTGASAKREDGVVTIDREQCVGCRSCMMACPYSNRYLNDETRDYFPGAGPTPYERARTACHEVGVVMKCDFCRDRVSGGKLPACVANCPAVARYFGDLDNPESQVSNLIRQLGGFTLLPEEGTRPAVYYLPAKR